MTRIDRHMEGLFDDPDYYGGGGDPYAATTKKEFSNLKIHNMKAHDFSLHFTIKGQSVEEIKQAFADFVVDQHFYPNVGIMHHCFLPRKIVTEKGFPTELVDFLDEVTPRNVCWNDGITDIHDHRLSMIQHMTATNGLAIFIGEIKEGVAEELDLCHKWGLQTIKIKTRKQKENETIR